VGRTRFLSLRAVELLAVAEGGGGLALGGAAAFGKLGDHTFVQQVPPTAQPATSTTQPAAATPDASRPIFFGGPETGSLVEAVLISGSPSPTSKSRSLLERAREQLESAGYATTTVDLATLSADGLLGRRPDEQVQSAVDAVRNARIVVASSPTYRATYSGLLKTFFDLLPPDSLKGKVGVPILTGGGPSHQLAVDHTFRPLFASLGAQVVRGVYGHDAQFKQGPEPGLLGEVDAAVEDAVFFVDRTGVSA